MVTKEALTRLFFTIITSILKFSLFLYLFSLLFGKLFTYFLRRDIQFDDDVTYEDDEYDEDESSYEDEEYDEKGKDEEEFKYSHGNKNNHLIADIMANGEGLVFMSEKLHQTKHNNLEHHEHRSSYETIFEDSVENFEDDAEFYVEDCNTSSDSKHDLCGEFADYEVIKEAYEARFGSTDDDHDDHNIDLHQNKMRTSQTWHYQWNDESINEKNSTTIELKEHDSVMKSENNKDESYERGIEVVKEINASRYNREIEVVKETNFTTDDTFLIFDPPKSNSTKMQSMDTEIYEIFEDTYTIGSTSKSSSEWRSSLPDSGTEDPFSSSSRRSCPKWESYTVYQKYDEEMTFLDRISAQKLHETESLRSFQVEPRSISQRIVHKLGNKLTTSEQISKKTYDELEAAYVAQICLAWEALNWNYDNFRRKRISVVKGLQDYGCPACIAQQFQQFQVLLQRYIENEPYERGLRPQIYARMRSGATKLLQVPEYHDYEGEDKEEPRSTRITTELFLSILEDASRTFMDFLKADRTTHCQLLTALFKKRRKGSVDPAILHLVKKHCKKKKLKVKELRSTCILFRKKKIEREEEMEILMSLIDLEVVSRVLRMADLTQQQLKWCEEKMDKVRLLEKKLQRDPSPLFFPAHSHDKNTLVPNSP